jgi:antitoxin YefM
MMTRKFFKALRLRSNLILRKLSFKKTDTTSYLLQSPNNAVRLLKGLEEYEKGLGKERKLIDK